VRLEGDPGGGRQEGNDAQKHIRLSKGCKKGLVVSNETGHGRGQVSLAVRVREGEELCAKALQTVYNKYSGSRSRGGKG